MSRGRQQAIDAKNRMLDRWSREDAAPRLADLVPSLVRLTLQIEEGHGANSIDSARYVRHIVVASAPAVFTVPCTEPNCEDGGHDVTREVLRGLGRGETEIRGETACRGRRGTEPCPRILRYTARAEYAAK
ncbi:MAG: hypothetical protein JW751_13675 [Polyangiaceae bacterium]|nr:hypothetical protein [Polyangiaceae bacterium]